MNQAGMEFQQDQQAWTRHPKRLWKEGQSKGEMPLSTPLHAFPIDSLVCRMAQGHEKVALSFAGQGHLDLDDMARLYQRAAIVRETVESATECLRQMSQLPEVRWSGVFGQGVELKTWLESPALRPSLEYLKSPLISQLVIFVHQVSRYRMLFQEGLSEAFLAGSICGVTGHSQGILPALLIAQSQGGAIEKERFVCCLRYLFWQGLSMALGLTAWRGPSTSTSTPMASVSGPDEVRLQQLLDQINSKLPATEQVVISLYNTHTRHVLSGSPKALSLVQQTLESIAQREAKQKQAGKRGGRNLTFQWDYLDTSGPYHSPAMSDALQMMQLKLKEEKFRLSASALIYDVYSPATGERYNNLEGDILEGLLLEQFVLPVQWHRTVAAIATAGKPTFWLDFGPGDGVLRLAYATLKGMGVAAISVANQSTEDNLFSANPTLPLTLDYQSFAPKTSPSASGALAVENRFTQATGLAPVILPGMTPTTADVPIVAAAANAGFVSELAGGGQVTEAIFWQRMDELRDALEPGREIVFNSLYMDRYLWDLHCGKTNLVGRARQAGYPICGITVSAGIPDVEEAVQLLDTWKSQGIWLNAFKPGTLAQIKQVARIAKAAPHHDIFVHLEGGKAGGHHSWESLDDLLLDGYHILREQANVILCVGGGIGTTERAVSLLKGDWSLAYARPIMPVDAIFVGTLAMACLEASTSPQVKHALVAAKGTPEWVATGKVDGHLTSGKSQLNADIHYIDNAASRCGRLLDQVAGDLEAVTNRRTEIIQALNATAKPFFGELTEMTYAQVATRLVELLACGRDGRYEDGAWIDRSYRTRCFDFLQRAEARLSAQQEGTLVSFLKGLDELDQPQAALERFVQAFPQASTTVMHPADIDYFHHQLCARPGKPVNFVPVIDADVRRWYKSDSLWQAHDDRYEAEQVLIIPGPEAVAGLDRADEPIASLLGRMNQALLQDLLDHPTQLDDQPSSIQDKEHLEIPEGLRIRREKHAILLEARGPNPGDWLTYLARRWTGPIAALARAPHVSMGTQIIPNPLQQLCIPHPGSSLHIETDQHDELISLRYQTQQTDQSGERAESLALYPEDTTPDSPLRMSIQLARTPGASPAQMGFSIIPSTQQHGQFKIDEMAYKKAIKALYQHNAPALDAAVDTLFVPRKAASSIPAMQARGYVQCTEGIAPKAGELPLNMAFSMVWEPLLQLLTSEELVAGMLQLVHLDHQVTPGPGWPLRADQSYEAQAAVTRIENKESGRLVRITATLSRDEECAATVESGFLIRGNFAHTAIATEAMEDLEETIIPQEQGAIDYLAGHTWLTLAEGIQLQAGQALRMELHLQERRMRRAMATYKAQGKLWRNDKCIGTIELHETSEATQHPLRVCLAQLQVDGQGRHTRPAAALSRTETEAPRDLRGFAAASGDFNPIHQSTLIARLAGLEGPIVHGMWTAGRLHSFLIDTLANGQASRCKAYQASFLAPVMPGEALRLEASRVAVNNGCLVIQATAQVYRGESWESAVQAEATIAPPKTAYIFPGQGIQQAQMGMAGYARSADARAIWEEADAYTRSTLGFSILQIVRDNPKELLVKGKSHIHPKGVLHLTQFTQVAMAVLAQAQIAELQGAGMLAQDAIICGHSVGEYNAIGAMGILPLQDIVEIVYQRGMVMHDLVPRDPSGESGYRMAVLRPHYAGMDHKAAERLVAKIQSDTGGFLEIVNYNVRDRQYAVTGDIAALTVLQKTVEAMATGSKSPYLEVPGIDVPFHSSRLRAGVDHFRETLDRRFPKVIDLDKLCGKYIPNLVPRPFTLQRDFIEEIIATTASPILTALLQSNDIDEMEPHALGRILLIELLAWQFTSPVRWIETQELLLHPDHIGGLGVESIIEVGVGYQPTLANMARYSLRLMGPFAPQVSILNADAETDQVFQRHTPTDLPAWHERQINTLHDTPSRPGMPHQEGASMILSAASREAMEAALRQQQAAPQPAAAPAPGVHAAAPTSGPATLADQQALQQALVADEALLCLLALQAKVRPEQIAMDETLDDLFAGVSSRRNQVLLDMGAEFAMTPIDGAHEIALKDLCATLRQRCPNYLAPGPYLKGAQDEAIKRTLGPIGLSRKELLDYLTSTYQAGHGLSQAILNTWTLDIREGKSGRGGSLGKQSGAIATKAAAWKSLDLAVLSVGQAKGLTIAKPQEASSGASAVDAAVVEALEARILGPDGILQKSAQELLQRLQPNTTGQAIDPAAAIATQQAAQLALYEAEFAPDYHKELQPCFDPRKHVALTSAWSSHRRDLSDLYFHMANGRWDQATIERATERLSRVCHTPILCKTAAWYAKQAASTGHMALAQTMAMLAEGKQIPTPPIAPTRPQIQLNQEGAWDYREAPLAADLSPRQQYKQFVDGLWSDPTHPFVTIGKDGDKDSQYQEILHKMATSPLAFAGRTVVVTGASPNSIALACVALFLRGGAQVVVTTSTYNPERIAFYRKLYEQEAALDAELHIVPFNQASNQDVDALINWLFGTETEQDGAHIRVCKRPFAPDILVPFAAVKDLATLDQLQARSHTVMRAMLLNVERMIAAIGATYRARGVPAQAMHVLLPLSPNHGTFGGDGVYAETKAALEVLCNKWHSERDAWSAAISLCAARIGWVRGTGLMDENNLVAPALEAEQGIRTFSSDEMGLLLTALCAPEMRKAAQETPLEADLTGGFASIHNLKETVSTLRKQLEDKARQQRLTHQLWATERKQLGITETAPTLVQALPNWPMIMTSITTQPELTWPSQSASLADTIVLVGAGELGPCGSSRTRYQLEVDSTLAPAAILELAWMTGLIQYQNTGKPGWIDTETKESIPESEIATRYRDAVRQRVGIRMAEPDGLGFDPAALPVMASVYLEQDLHFSVASQEEADAFLQAAPDTTRCHFDPSTEQWQVTRLAGTEIRVPRQARLERQVVGSIPQGFAFQRYGITQDMIDNIDRLTLFNLVATIDAFVSAGLSPEELLTWMHPARVANTQGSGIGGMQSLHRLYLDHFTGTERQGDQLQETLINVVAAHVVQSYIGSYGAMAHPVAACATAAVSLEEGMDKLRLGKADFVVTGGYDDLGIEGMVGFSDMNATANTDQMTAMGLTPGQMSRGNDARRRGFVEAQGGGTILMTRGDIAARMGLPVLGVLAYTGSFGDGIHKSIPAPGLGALAAVSGGKQSPLAWALGRHGLTTDDIALVYKHDTSTAANDPNENRLHHTIQETLERTEGNPLYVVSQKSLTGHAKGGAAAWQAIGLCQALQHGVIPGNRNLDCVDEEMRAFHHMSFSNKSLHPGQAVTMRAGLLTSLGFGHVSGIALVLHPASFLAMLSAEEREAYQQQVAAREQGARHQWASILMAQTPAYQRRNHRRFAAEDGSPAQITQEIQMLLNPESRLDLQQGHFVQPQSNHQQ